MAQATTEWDIYSLRSRDGGDSWDPIVRLTDAPGPSQRPVVAVDGQEVHVVWFDARDGNAEVYYKFSSDGGTTWGPDQRLTAADGDSVQPSIAVGPDALHVAWFDTRDGNPEIYYKRKPR